MFTRCFLVAFCVLLPVILGYSPIETKKMVAKINSNPSSTWKAKDYGQSFPVMPEMPIPEKPDYVQIRDSNLPRATFPETFDSESNFNCVTPVRNQKNCGSCWAFAAAMVLQDRMCIKGIVDSNYVVSTQEFVSCDNRVMKVGSYNYQNTGCGGGFSFLAWKYAADFGISSDSCYPYDESQTTTAATCKLPSATCPGGAGISNKKLFSSQGSVWLTTESAIMDELMRNGPVEAQFTVYDDFSSYSSGVYIKSSDKSSGGHAVVITGWGVDNGVKYWKVKNSWGGAWGESGYFRIRRGTNEVGIEKFVYTTGANETYGYPSLFSGASRPWSFGLALVFTISSCLFWFLF